MLIDCIALSLIIIITMMEVEHNQTEPEVIELKLSISIDLFSVQSAGKLTSEIGSRIMRERTREREMKSE